VRDALNTTLAVQTQGKLVVYLCEFFNAKSASSPAVNDQWLQKRNFYFQKGDKSLLAQFYYADEELSAVTAELDSLDGKKDPEKCTALVAQLRQCQDKVALI
jgi:hypothetical protein